LAVIRYAKIHGTKHRPWLTALLARRPTKVAAIVLANKIARMAWAILAKGERYKESAALAMEIQYKCRCRNSLVRPLARTAAAALNDPRIFTIAFCSQDWNYCYPG
jgi:hypothetical protein